MRVPGLQYTWEINFIFNEKFDTKFMYIIQLFKNMYRKIGKENINILCFERWDHEQIYFSGLRSAVSAILD